MSGAQVSSTASNGGVGGDGVAFDMAAEVRETAPLGVLAQEDPARVQRVKNTLILHRSDRHAASLGRLQVVSEVYRRRAFTAAAKVQSQEGDYRTL